MTEKLEIISGRKKILDKHKPFSPIIARNLDEWFRVELTYTSNAIEGNTLSRAETAQVIEKGLTVAGKTLREHLEAINHAQAYDFIKKLVKRPGKKLSQQDILDIHRIILHKIDETNAGRYRSVPVRIAGSKVILPNPRKVADLMDDFEGWLTLGLKEHPAKKAADAHFTLVTIHPFVDGNGRCARLLMNLILMQSGYPPAIIKKEERVRYINSLEKAQLGGSQKDYYDVIFQAVERSLNIYLEAVGEREIASKKGQLIKIGELAKKTGETVHTIRFWTKQGLLEVRGKTSGGYQLYDYSMIVRIKEIRQLQKEKRLTIGEIKQQF